MFRICELLLFFPIFIHGSTLFDVSQLIDCMSACSNVSCVNICNDLAKEISLYPQVVEDTKANITLHCTGGNVMMIKFNPGVYMIEQILSNHTWTPGRLVKGDIAAFTHLAAGSNYKYRLYNVTYEGIWRPDISEWFSTYPAKYQPLPVKNISLLNIEPDKKKKGSLRATVAFEPASDQSCNYEVVAWNGEHTVVPFNIDMELSCNASTNELFEVQTELIPVQTGSNIAELDTMVVKLQLNELQMPHFQFELGFLTPDQNNSLLMRSVNRQNNKASTDVTMMFSTHSCLTYYSDLTVCPPEPVKGLTVEHIYCNEGLCDVRVHWNKTTLEPDNYTVQIDVYGNDTEFSEQTVPGNTTMITFPKLKLGPQYQVDIIAESMGGISPPVSMVKFLNNEYATTNNFYHKLIIGIMVLIMFIVVVRMAWLPYRRQKNKKFSMTCVPFENINKKDLPTPSIKKMVNQNYCDSDMYNTLLINDKFKLCPKLLNLKGILGSGAYGIVRLGTLQDEHDNIINVAVKMLKDNPSVEDLQSFNKEIVIMKAAGQHPNIVSLIGCCTLDNKPVLVVEYCCKGDMQTYLRTIWQNMVSVVFNHKTHFEFDADLFSINGMKYVSSSSGGNEHSYQNVHTITNRLYDVEKDISQYTEIVTANDLLNFARQIATGMEFLSENRIVHRDLAARNILVCADRVVKISDFGLSRDIYQENLYKKQGSGKLPVKWMAIEALTHQIYTTQSDVWSFGILLWEIVTMGALPYPGISTNSILKLLKSGYRMERPISCSVELYNIMLSCWNVRPQSRPTFSQLKDSLDKLLALHSDNKYLDIDEILYDA